MSEIRVNTIANAEGIAAPTLPYGVQVPTGMGITGAGGVNISGVVTAANIDGTLIAGSALNSSGVSTVGRLELSKDANIGAAITVAGISKFTNTTDSTSSTTGGVIVTGGLGVAKNVYIGAGLSVAGTLTYQDVTEVDSVGLITAQSGVNVSGGQLQVGVAYSVGAAGVATALGFVAGTSGFSGDINITANNSTNETVYPVFVDGATGVQGLESDTGLTYNPSSGNLSIGGELAAASLDISGNADIDGTMEADAYTVNGTALNTYIAGITVTNCTTAAAVTVADESSDTTCFPLFVDGATGNLSPKSGTNLTFNSSSGLLSATLLGGTINDAAQTNITSLGTLTGLTVSGDLFFDNGSDANKDLRWDVSEDALHFNDSVYAYFGSDSDLKVWHDGSNGYVRNTTGSFLFEAKSGENAIVAVPDAEVKLYHNNSEKIRTTNDGVKIVGMTTVTTGAHFQGMLREECNIVANKLSADTNIDLEDGMIHYYSTNETTTATPNIRWNSSYSLNNKMSTGETVTVTIIYKPNGSGYYAALNVDGSGVTEEWNGGDAPSSAESGGYDVLTHTLIKTGNASFLCLSNVSNFA